MVRLNYDVVAMNSMRQGAPAASQSSGLLTAFRASAVLLLLASVFTPTKVLAGTVIGGTANPSRAYNSDHTLYVDALTVRTPITWAFGEDGPTVFQVIQNAMNRQLKAAGQAENWPLPKQGALLNVTFTVTSYLALDWNTQPPPLKDDLAGASLRMTTNMPVDKHWLQLTHANYLAGKETTAKTWADPNGNGYWSIDNDVTPGQPFYDLVPGSPATVPNFVDGAGGQWNGTSYLQAYLFVAEMDPASHVITLHDGVFWGFTEPHVVPEPSALVLLAIGALALLLRGRGRKFAGR
jgi:hypothetical protein